MPVAVDPRKLEEELRKMLKAINALNETVARLESRVAALEKPQAPATFQTSVAK